MNTILPFRRALLSSAICLLASPALLGQTTESEMLEEVVVMGVKQPYRGDAPLEELPQQVQVLSGDLLVDIGAVDLQSALDVAGGVARQNSFGGLWDSFAIRGFAGDENLPSGYLINGFSGGRGFSGNRDSSNIETIEVLKGPGSALYGRGEPGGTINIVTKKPQFDREGYLRISAGRYDTYRAEADYTNALTDKVAFRVNGAYVDSQSFRDYISTEKLSLTPSVLFLVGDKTAINYELEYLNQETPFDRGIVSIDRDPEVLPVSRFLGEPGDGPIEIEALGHQLTLSHDFNAGWSLLGGLGYRVSSFEGSASDPELSGIRQKLTTDGRTLTRQKRFRDYEADDISGRIELTGTFDTGGLTHHLLIGADSYKYELDSLQTRFRVSPGSDAYTLDIFNPVYGQEVVTPNATLTDRLEKQDARGLYLQNQIDVTERLKFLVGLRYDDFSQEIKNRANGTTSKQDQTQTSPRAGISFLATDSLTLYASYSEGFRPNSGADFSGKAFEPEESKSYEAGLKYVTNDGRLSTTLAYFKMEKTNVITADPVNSGFSAALGEAESEGLELDITGDLTDTLRMMLTYAYVDAETSNDVINADWGVGVPAGSPLVNIPEHSANLMLIKSLDINGSPASVGASVNYVDKRLGETIDPDYWLPEYTLVNLFGSYNVSDSLKFKVNLDNIFNEKYYVSSYHKWWTMPGESMTWTVSAEYSF